MKTLVVYDSKFGNTEKLARVIGEELEALGPVQVRPVGSAHLRLAEAMDLLVVGGPTEFHGMTPEMRVFTEAVGTTRARIRATAFDTRYRMSTLLTGSAAARIARRLRRLGLTLIAPPESFFVTREGEPRLEDGEIERAREWATSISANVLSPTPSR